MTNVVRFYHIYNFVATQLRERLSKMLVTPEHTTIPQVVKDGKILSDDDLLVYHIMYDTVQKYFAQDTKHKTRNYIEHFLATHNIQEEMIPVGMRETLKRDYEDFIMNRFCLGMINCYSNQDKEFEPFDHFKF